MISAEYWYSYDPVTVSVEWTPAPAADFHPLKSVHCGQLPHYVGRSALRGLQSVALRRAYCGGSAPSDKIPYT